jgi:hypothetical protein
MGKRLRKEGLLSLSDFFSRSTVTIAAPLISPPAQGATVLKVPSNRLDVWSRGTVVCL